MVNLSFLNYEVLLYVLGGLYLPFINLFWGITLRSRRSVPPLLNIVLRYYFMFLVVCTSLSIDFYFSFYLSFLSFDVYILTHLSCFVNYLFYILLIFCLFNQKDELVSAKKKSSLSAADKALFLTSIYSFTGHVSYTRSFVSLTDSASAPRSPVSPDPAAPFSALSYPLLQSRSVPLSYFWDLQ